MRKITINSNPIFKPVHQCEKRYVVMKGSAGSGKSVDTAQMYILRLMKDCGRNLVCVRKSDITNRDSTFAELESAINRMGVAAAWKVTQSPLSFTCINGNKIIFRGVNDNKQREKLKSITFAQGKLTDVWIEEATELVQQDLEIIDDRLRGELPDGLFYQIKMTFNPVSSSHWIKKTFFDYRDDNVLTHHSTYLDNRFCDSAYKERMRRRAAVDPEGYKIYGLGEWGETGGLIFSNFKIEEFDVTPERFDAMAIGQDFGYNHANAILTLGYKDGEIYICSEIYLYEKDTDEIIKEAAGKVSKNHIMWCDSAEPDRIKMWRKAGYRAKPVVKNPNSVQAQIDWLKGRTIHIHCSCKNTIREIQQWRWRLDEKSNTYTDEPVNEFDDAMAALRYGVEAWRKDRRARVVSRKEFYI
ncbi:MAG: PBSX family phage terminase large subunit [Oscillospiraceae bacterium]|nr:PBSX family phage terminase large subunit [Oscillospiraceae bacterium]